MPKEKRELKEHPPKYKEKVTIDADFHGAMKLLAHHANTKGTAKITYKKRNSAKGE
jgi:hypothetical protein